MTIQHLTPTNVNTLANMQTKVRPLTFDQFIDRLTFVMAWKPNEYLAKSLYEDLIMSKTQNWSDYYLLTQYLALEDFMEA